MAALEAERFLEALGEEQPGIEPPEQVKKAPAELAMAAAVANGSA